MNTLQGVPISSGIAVGKVYLKKNAYEEEQFREVVNVEEEKKRFQDSREMAVKQMEKIYIEMLHRKGEQEASIFLAHIEMLNDTELIKSVENILDEKGCNSEWAVKTVRDNYVEIFEAMDDEYMRERAMDIKDVCRRVIENLKGNKIDDSFIMTEPAIIISEDLSPSDTAQMNQEFVLGIINEKGGPTSHAAIIARMIGIPFVIYPQITSVVKNGQIVAFDGEEGIIELDVNEITLKTYIKKQDIFKQRKHKLEELKGTKSITTDGHEILIAGNIGVPEDANHVLKEDGHGIGLFRTEFLYMNRKNSPTEEEQFVAYKEIAEKMQGNPVIIRTLDIGGDKEVDYLKIPKEENPFLGYRAIRLCLDRVPFWKTQLKALLRASIFGNIQIMFPMIVSIDELLEAKQILEDVKEELRGEEIEFNENVPIGMMMETPAAALMADAFAKEVDFFSIGTNDLIQYTMAVDRMNSKVGHLYSQFDPAVIRLIKKVVESAHESGIWVGICGEAAADKNLLPIWIGLGLDELSMSPVSILLIREKIQKLSKTTCEELVKKILLLKTAKEVEITLKKYS